VISIIDLSSLIGASINLL